MSNGKWNVTCHVSTPRGPPTSVPSSSWGSPSSNDPRAWFAQVVRGLFGENIGAAREKPRQTPWRARVGGGRTLLGRELVEPKSHGTTHTHKRNGDEPALVQKRRPITSLYLGPNSQGAVRRDPGQNDRALSTAIQAKFHGPLKHLSGEIPVARSVATVLASFCSSSCHICKK